jgi:hypothetical protein
MFGTSQCPKNFEIDCKMNYTQVLLEQKVEDFLVSVEDDDFTKLIFTFMSEQYKLTNPKLNDYEQMLETFRQQHYHKFLFHYKDRNKFCLKFIEYMKNFNKKPKKKDYIALFHSIGQLFHSIVTPGGHYKGTPFIFTDRSYEKWFYDEVNAERASLGFNKGTTCMVCGKTGASETFFYPIYKNGQWTGHTELPANKISRCNNCQQMSCAFATYLIKAGYESVQTVQDQWKLKMNAEQLSNWKLKMNAEQQNNWGITCQNVDDTNELISELKSYYVQSASVSLKLCNKNTPIEEVRKRAYQEISKRTSTAITHLIRDHRTLQNNYETLEDQLSDQTMILNTKKRKLKDMEDELCRVSDELSFSKQQQVENSKRSMGELYHLRNALFYTNEEIRKLRGPPGPPPGPPPYYTTQTN